MEVTATNSIKGLIDYPKDIAIGTTRAGIKLAGKGIRSFDSNKHQIIDSFKSSKAELKNGNLDKAIVSGANTLGNIAGATVNSVKTDVGAVVTVGAGIPAVILHNLDKAGENIADKLEKSDNQYAKTVGSFFRLLCGKNS